MGREVRKEGEWEVVWREGRGIERKQSSSCTIFHDLALEVTLLHFHTVLLVTVISTVL